MARHLNNIPGVNPIPTIAYRKLHAVAPDVVERRGILAVSGEPGAGKTYATTQFTASSSVPHVWLEFRERPSGKEVVVRLLRAIAGGCDHTLPEYLLIDELCEHLSARQRIVVIDEAQNLKQHGLEQLRYIHGRRNADFALVLVGWNVNDILKSSKALHSRVSRHVHFEELTGVALTTALQSYHPLLANTDPRLLTKLDERLCHGNLREWAKLLDAAIDVAAKRRTDRVTIEVAKIVVSLLTARAA
jgi:DNA transposition AAA+ family ATPase